MRKFLLLVSILCANMVSAKVDFRVIPLPQKIQLDETKIYRYVQGTEVKKSTTLKSDNPEAYRITIDKKGITIEGASKQGLMYGESTLWKAIALEGDTVDIPYGVVENAPRFEYRGAMLDCARHFMPTSFIYKYIDILALHGMNTFHWHLTDDQGWRFEVKSMPLLTERGQYRARTVIGHNCDIYDDTPEMGYYTQEEMKQIVKYAEERGITIIPEIDLPGHMIAALSVYPNLGCTGGPYDVWSDWGVSPDVLCAGNPDVLKFLKTVLGELCDVFPSKIIHIGGDESPRDRWKACPKCQAKMQELGLKNEAGLQTYINKELDKFLTERGRTLMGWDETLEGGLSDNAIVMSWRGYEGGKQAAQLHHPVVMTPTGYCYIDYYQLKDRAVQPLSIGGYVPLSKVYDMEPVPSDLTPEEAKYIIGTQVNLWTEYVLSPEHVQYMLLPRLAAMSEVQWLKPENKNFQDFTERLQKMYQIYDKLGYRYCPKFE